MYVCFPLASLLEYELPENKSCWPSSPLTLIYGTEDGDYSSGPNLARLLIFIKLCWSTALPIDLHVT